MTPTVLNLGDLEIATLEELWTAGPLDARAVHARLGKARGISLSTVQSTLERLHRKGLLSRDKVSHAYIYEATMSRDSVMARLVDAALKRFKGGRRDGLLAAFAGYAAAADEQTLGQLERLIAERKAGLTEEGEA
ncbi:MAG: BlaI/MecI/CopY family transcriptional regulator [Alphaproteobacteria bacterium]